MVRAFVAQATRAHTCREDCQLRLAACLVGCTAGRRSMLLCPLWLGQWAVSDVVSLSDQVSTTLRSSPSSVCCFAPIILVPLLCPSGSACSSCMVGGLRVGVSLSSFSSSSLSSSSSPLVLAARLALACHLPRFRSRFLRRPALPSSQSVSSTCQ